MTPNGELRGFQPYVIAAFAAIVLGTLAAIAIGSPTNSGCFLNKDRHVVCLDAGGRVENTR